jgi:hypothetical protein
MHDVAEFLKAHEPFSGLEVADLDRLVARAKVECFTAGTIIFRQGGLPTEWEARAREDTLCYALGRVTGCRFAKRCADSAGGWLA